MYYNIINVKMPHICYISLFSAAWLISINLLYSEFVETYFTFMQLLYENCAN